MEQRSFRSSLLGLALLSIISSTHAAKPVPIPIADFARHPAIQSVSMSPDGKRLVALISSADGSQEPSLANWDMDKLEAGPVSVTPAGERMKFIGASAMKAGKTLVVARQEWTGRLGICGEGNSTGATKTFITKAYITDTKQTSFDEAFASNVRKAGVSEDRQRCAEISGSAALVHMLPLEPDHVLVRQLNQSTLSADYFRYNLKTGATELVVRSDDQTSPGLFHPRTGELLTRTAIKPSGSNEFDYQMLIKDSASGQFVVHDALTTKLSERFAMRIGGIDEASGKLYVLTDRFSDHVQAWAYDPATRAFDKEPLAAHPNFSISGLILDRRSASFNSILGFVVDAERAEDVYIEPRLKALHEGLKQAYPGQSVVLQDYNDDLSRVLFQTDSARYPVTHHVLVDGRKVTKLGSELPWIDPNRIGTQRWVSYRARDGREIPAILDLPVGWKEGDPALPAIIHPHGGPWHRDRTGWDPSGWVPFLTSRGYAVLRPQYRGSLGLGRSLLLAGDREWGARMQDDKDDGAAWLVSQGIAAKDRVAIFGYSYGGFAAAAAVVRTPSPYQCAISGAPVTDLARLGNRWGSTREMRVLQAQTVKGMDPMRNTEKASLPVLLYVGDRDVRTPAFHARSFHNAVKDRVASRLEIIPDMPHSMPWYPRHIEASLSLIESYLKNDCGPGGL